MPFRNVASVSDIPATAVPLDRVSVFVPGDATVLYDAAEGAAYLAHSSAAARRLPDPSALLDGRDLCEALAVAARLIAADDGGPQAGESRGAAEQLLWQAGALFNLGIANWAALQPEAQGAGAGPVARAVLRGHADAAAAPPGRWARRATRQRRIVEYTVARVAAARLDAERPRPAADAEDPVLRQRDAAPGQCGDA